MYEKKYLQHFLAVFSLLLCTQVQGQYTWDNLGPDNMGSRTRALAFDNNGNLLAGSQGGGLWMSSDKGVSWSRVTSYNGNPNITSIAVDGNTIVVGTGATAFELSYYVTALNQNSTYDYRTNPDGFKGYLTGLPGGGVYVSSDNGENWAPADGTNTSETIDYKGPFSSIQKVAVINGKVFIATIEGLYYSDNKQVSSLTKATGPEDFTTGVVYDVEGADGTVVLATARKGFSDKLYRSTDGGATFEAVEDDALTSLGPFSSIRSEIAVAPSDKKIIYVGGTQANNEISGVFRSSDNGATWSVYGPKGSPGFTPLGTGGRNAFAMEVFPDNPNELIIAGNSWYTFIEGRGWNPTATHTLPVFRNYIPRSIYDIAFDPSDDQMLFVGTDQQIARSEDRGETFSLKTKGYEASVTYGVGSMKVNTLGEEEIGLDLVIAGTETNGYLLNRHFSSESATRQGYGDIFNVNFGKIAPTYLTPGALIMEGTDGGPMRSFNAGTNSERFYGLPGEDTVQSLDFDDGSDIIDRSGPNVSGGALFDRPTVAQSAWVLDEVIPESSLGKDDLTIGEIAEASEQYLFWCSGKYVWIGQGVFGDGLQVKWNRITNSLVDGATEFLSAIAVSGDDNHTLYVGSSKGKFWRIDRAHDLANFDISVNVVRLDNLPTSNLSVMAGRGITDISVDPQDPERVALTFGGYGGSVQNTQNLVWITDGALSDPVFGRMTGGGIAEPAYSVEFIEDPAAGESILLLGTESKLYSIRDIQKQLPQLYFGQYTDESGENFSNAPIYDIFVRRYHSTVTEDALTRIEERVNVLPDGTVVTNQVEVQRSAHKLEKDNTIFIASHGLGIWSTSSVLLGREGNTPDPVDIELSNVSLYPNPARNEANIKLELSGKSIVNVVMYTVDGRILSETNKTFSNGIHEINYDTSNLAPGMYFFRVDVQGDTESISKTLKSVVVH